MKVLYPGSFDPMTKGHEDLIKRTSLKFDEVVVLVAINTNKRYAFDIEERYEMVKKVCSKYPNVTVDKTDGLTADYCISHNIFKIVKGIRNLNDLRDELKQRKFNSEKNKNIKTIFLKAKRKLRNVSSTLVRYLGRNDLDFYNLVPEEIYPEIKQKIK